LRPRPGNTTSKLPSASFFIAEVKADKGLDTARPIRNASAPTPKMTTRMAICMFSVVLWRDASAEAAVSVRILSTSFSTVSMTGSTVW
jgi:hypothetical protein